MRIDDNEDDDDDDDDGDDDESRLHCLCSQISSRMKN